MIFGLMQYFEGAIIGRVAARRRSLKAVPRCFLFGGEVGEAEVWWKGVESDVNSPWTFFFFLLLPGEVLLAFPLSTGTYN